MLRVIVKQFERILVITQFACIRGVREPGERRKKKVKNEIMHAREKVVRSVYIPK